MAPLIKGPDRYAQVLAHVFGTGERPIHPLLPSSNRKDVSWKQFIESIGGVKNECYGSIMTSPRKARSANELGPTGRRVASNLHRVRQEVRHLTTRELSRRLDVLGRPIAASGITKIEQGDRRVDADDLVALAAALEVTPDALLGPDGSGDDEAPVTEVVTGTSTDLWRWLGAEQPLVRWAGTEIADRGFGRRVALSFLHGWWELTRPWETEEERDARVRTRLKLTRKGKAH